MMKTLILLLLLVDGRGHSLIVDDLAECERLRPRLATLADASFAGRDIILTCIAVGAEEEEVHR